MSATRLLILGALRFLQPAHGYSVRRELESWSADKWANIAYGSIYHALHKLAEEDLIQATLDEGASKRPPRVRYTVTPLGEEEFQRLLREYWWDAKPMVDPFQVAAAFMDELPRDELLAALRHRLAFAAARQAELEFFTASPQMAKKPRHVAQNLALTVERFAGEIRWIGDTIAKVERGELP
jgi:DNA-binding PadR family transcriptional regulator